MPRYIAFLRGINLGKRRIKMDALRALFAELPLTDVATYIASGNVLFTSSSRSPAKLEATIESHLQTRTGWDVPTVIRSLPELQRIVDEAPLGDLFTDQPHASTQVTFFKTPVPAELASRITATHTATDRFAVIDREAYWRCATKLTESIVWNDQKNSTYTLPAGTTRNLNTLQAILAL
ncbi:DUF1697 domain-containing protein [Actomonas aquatica]|uniref:DUF1697 domain-containing protein n=1 Tax=Actomonas aquatica TaxID=2866162 RepID=A0ABZ1CES7_9BACT|nr:DUF1697 domain-containing protein [Opitutus sp. WL0086]WRQ88785.1 DUF1697 domain-containing protein [Opitutus sp. WL0086]